MTSRLPSSSEFWDDLVKEADLSGGGTGSIDAYLSGKEIGGHPFDSVRELTDGGRAARAVQTPVKKGTRVTFKANLGAVLTYTDAPDDGLGGTVVTVKSANGPVTSHNGKVFVQWDDGKFRGIHAEHLRYAGSEKRPRGKKGSHRIRVGCLGDLTQFLKLGDDTLIHKSTRDLWSFRRDGQDYDIERLFDDSGEPLKG